MTEAIYDAGFNSGGRFYETSDQLLGMTPTDYRAGGADTEIRFAVGECSLGIHSGRPEREGRLRHPARRRSGCAGARSPGPLSARDARRRRCGVRADRREGDWLCRSGRRSGSTCRSTCAAPRFSSACGRRFARFRRVDGELHRDCGAHRRPERRTRRGPGLRRESAGRGDSLPPRREDRRIAVRLPLGRRAQAEPTREGRSCMNTASDVGDSTARNGVSPPRGLRILPEAPSK